MMPCLLSWQPEFYVANPLNIDDKIIMTCVSIGFPAYTKKEAIQHY
jgi:hypothetical protein